MSKGNENAYPQTVTREVVGQYHTFAAVGSEGGLTKRELFAAMAMQGLLATPDYECTPASCAKLSVQYADALIEALAKTEGGG
jgi:hypothetical protein